MEGVAGAILAAWISLFVWVWTWNSLLQPNPSVSAALHATWNLFEDRWSCTLIPTNLIIADFSDSEGKYWINTGEPELCRYVLTEASFSIEADIWSYSAADMLSLHMYNSDIEVVIFSKLLVFPAMAVWMRQSGFKGRHRPKKKIGI